jgi:hypothetical protein
LVAFSPYLAVALLALFVGGAAWLLVLSTFNVTVQLRTPPWVVGRAMAIYQAGVFGGLAFGGWLWGVVAEHYGLPTSLMTAAVALALTAALGRVLPMPGTERTNVEPAPGEPDAESGRPALDLDSGPVVASTEYRIASPNVRAFLAGMSRLRRMRRRNGARRWALLQDAANPEVWVERFETATWVDHLRVRDRMTVVDREVENAVVRLHEGSASPLSRYLLAHVPVIEREDALVANESRTDVFDASLPPAFAPERS